jgi:hypothetical protein
MRRQLAGVVALGIGLLSSWSSYGQNASDGERRLAGATSRTWVFKRVVKSMGAAEGCSSGETYTFSANHQMTVSVCTGGHMADTKYAWSISDAGNGDVAIAITGMGSYLLLFKSPPGGDQLMRLRRNGVNQTDPVQDKEFSLDED